ncbi:MAG: peptide chain release factor N(5)-glutamine methyltransferase [Kiritimatiellia bacterium]
MICRSDATTLTIGRLLESGAAYLLRKGLSAEEARTQSEILISEILALPSLQLSFHRDVVPPSESIDRLRSLFHRVGHGEPVQYVIGHWPFHNIELKTDARALIPRPETEVLVERVLASPGWSSAHHILDIGTGTGAIILALAHAARGTDKTFTAIDLSPEALSLARENASALGLSISFIEGNGCAQQPQASADIIISNPPYISTADVDALPPLIRAHEPRLALDGGADGLNLLRQILLDATQVLRPGGRLFFEIGDDQGLSLRRLLDCAGYTDVVIAKDFAGHDRYAEGSLP